MRKSCSALALFILLLIAIPAGAAAEESELNAEYWWDQFVKLFNIALVIGALFFILRKPVSNFFKNRAAQIDESIQNAQTAREKAEGKLAEVEKQVAELQDRIAEIKRKAESDGEAEKARMIASAEREAERILEGAKREIENLVKAGRRELKAYAADMAAEKALLLLKERLAEEDDQRLIERSIEEIKGAGLQ